MGIDYGMGKTNVDPKTGIRYGVISMHEVSQAWCDESEADYGKPTGDDIPNRCNECGEEVELTLPDEFDWGDSLECPECWEPIAVDLPDCAEPNCHFVDNNGLKATCGEHNDIFIIESPYYTWCDYCSPCAPGAGYLTSSRTIEDGKDNPKDWDTTNDCKAYCLGHDWFDSQATGKWIDCKYCNATGYRKYSDLPGKNSPADHPTLTQADDNRFVCNVCEVNHPLGQIGKVRESHCVAPYRVFRVDNDEEVLPSDERNN